MRTRSVEDLHQAFARWTDHVNNYAVADIHAASAICTRDESLCARPQTAGVPFRLERRARVAG